MRLRKLMSAEFFLDRFHFRMPPSAQTPNGCELSGAGRPTSRVNHNAREPPDGVRFSEGLGDAFI